MSKLLILFFALFCAQVVEAAPVISVRIGKSLKNINVSGFDIKRKLVFNDDTKVFEGRKTVKFNCHTHQSLNKEKNKPLLLATLESMTGFISYDNVKYKGQFKVVTNPKGDSCDIINDVPMETYIATLLAKEMNPNWHIEALKAQAVAARSYALHKMQTQQVSKELGSEAFYDLESSEKHQVSGAYYDATEKTKQASLETKGEVLVDPTGKIGPVFFHAKCGGKTILPDQVWKNSESGYRSVRCQACKDRGPKDWSSDISIKRMMDFLKWLDRQEKFDRPLVTNIQSIMLVPDKISADIVKLYINKRPYEISKPLLRRYFGNVIFPSNSFILKVRDEEFYVDGSGLGHGVGLCQTGALGLAQRGWDYKKILSFYFPGHTLKKMY